MRSRGSYSEEEYERIKIGAQLEEELRYARDGLSFFEELERTSRSTYRMELRVMKATELTKAIKSAIDSGEFDGSFSPDLKNFQLIPAANAPDKEQTAHEELRETAKKYLEKKLALAAKMPLEAAAAFTGCVHSAEWSTVTYAVDFPFSMVEALESIKHHILVIIPTEHETADGKSAPVLNTTTSALQSASHKDARIAERPTVLAFSYACNVESGKRSTKGTVTLAYSSPKDMSDGTPVKAIKALVECGYEPFVREGKNSPNAFNRIKIIGRLLHLDKTVTGDLLQDVEETDEGKQIIERYLESAFDSPKFDSDGRIDNSIFE
jgi:hypothetical protein